MNDVIRLSNLAQLDEQIFNTWDSVFGGVPIVLDRRGEFARSDEPMDAGPGAFVAPDELERGFNAWSGAPGYYIDARTGVDRVINDQYLEHTYPPAIGTNPWDYVFGTIGGDPIDLTDRVRPRQYDIQAGEYSLS